MGHEFRVQPLRVDRTGGGRDRLSVTVRVRVTGTLIERRLVMIQVEHLYTHSLTTVTKMIAFTSKIMRYY